MKKPKRGRSMRRRRATVPSSESPSQFATRPRLASQSQDSDSSSAQPPPPSDKHRERQELSSDSAGSGPAADPPSTPAQVSRDLPARCRSFYLRPSVGRPGFRDSGVQRTERPLPPQVQHRSQR